MALRIFLACSVLRNCSPCEGKSGLDGNGDDVSDRLERADGSSACGFEDGTYVGVLFCSPLGAESVGDFAIGGAGTQRAFGLVVGWGNFAIGHEDK